MEKCHKASCTQVVSFSKQFWTELLRKQNQGTGSVKASFQLIHKQVSFLVQTDKHTPGTSGQFRLEILCREHGYQLNKGSLLQSSTTLTFLKTAAAAAAAKSCQSCPTLCDPRDGSPPGSCPWDSPGKNTGVGCHFPLQCMKVKSESEVTQSCPTLRDLMDCSLLGSSVHGTSQARVLEWVAIAFSVLLFFNHCPWLDSQI